MRTIIGVAIVAVVIAIAVWMIRLGRRDIREMRASSDPTAPMMTVGKAQLGGGLVGLPLLAFFWPPSQARTWFGVVYLSALCIVLALIVRRRRRQSA